MPCTATQNRDTFFPYPIWDHHLLRPKRLRKIILGNLGIENGKWII